MEHPINAGASTPEEAPPPSQEATTAVEETRTRKWGDSGIRRKEGLLDITNNLAETPLK